MIGAYITLGKTKKKWFFTGENFDTSRKKMAWYESSADLDSDIGEAGARIGEKYTVFYLHRADKDKIKAAMDGYQRFTGHEPVSIEEIEVPSVGVGFKFGRCDGVLYTAVRDGVEERYIHEFRDSAKPDLVSAHDGRIIMLVGGAYRFTSRGIVDDE